MARSFYATATIKFASETFEISGTFTPGLPGRYSGLPENCYPGEPAEFELASVTWIMPSGAEAELPLQMLEVLTYTKQDFLEHLTDLALNELERAREEDAADDAYERACDRKLGL